MSNGAFTDQLILTSFCGIFPEKMEVNAIKISELLSSSILFSLGHL